MGPTNSNQNRPVVPPITAPTGIELRPAPRATVHISKRAGIAIIAMIVLLLVALAWGGYRRTLQNQANARDAGMPKSITPAHADDDLLRDIPPVDASVVHSADDLTAPKPNPLQAPSPMLPPNNVPSEGLPQPRGPGPHIHSARAELPRHARRTAQFRA
jgi:hypothetical protein